MYSLFIGYIIFQQQVSSIPLRDTEQNTIFLLEKYEFRLFNLKVCHSWTLT